MPLLNRSLRRLAATASVLALSACATVGPNFKPPEAPKGAAAAGYAMAGDAVVSGARLTPETRAAGPITGSARPVRPAMPNPAPTSPR